MARTRRNERLLDVEFAERETFAYSCEQNGAREEPAHHRLHFGARELDADVRGHRFVRVPFRQPTNLCNQRGAKISVRRRPRSMKSPGDARASMSAWPVRR